jgi:ABC-type branched-subunit amino acid transport system substrate-binding protein
MATKSAFPARVLLLLSVLGLLVAGCAGNSSGGASFKHDKGIDVSSKTINLGIITPLSGPVAAPIGIPLTKGIETYFKYVNDNNLIGGGYKVKLTEKDSKYDATTAAAAYNEIHNDVLMLAESLGTPPTFAIKDQATADHMLVTAATLSSALAREPYMVLTGTPYRLQFENAADYIVNPNNAKGLGLKAPKVGIIYQNDQYGQDGLQGYTEAVKFYDMVDVGQKAFKAGDKDVTAQVGALQAAGAQFVFVTSTPADTATILGTAASVFHYTPRWILQSPAFSTAFFANPQFTALLEATTWIVTQGAVWGDTTKPGMVEMLANVQKYAPDQKPDGFFEAGYAFTKVTTAILHQAYLNGDMTRDGLRTAFESLRFVDLGGLYSAPSYGGTANQRVPTRDSQIFKIDHTSPTGGTAISDDFTGDAARASSF